MKIVSSVANDYAVGITGDFSLNISSSISRLVKKLTQIGNYCRRFNKPVLIYLDAKCPHYVYKVINTLGFSIKPVIQGKSDGGNNIFTENMANYLESVCEVILVIDVKDKKGEYDFQVPISFIPVISSNRRRERFIADPRDQLKDHVYKAKQAADPYSAFYHEPLYEVEPWNYWNELMDTKPEDRDPQDREFT